MFGITKKLKATGDRKRTRVLPILLSLFLLPAIASADDVDVYVSAPVNLPQPNVLFVLDRSGSMRFDEDGNNASTSGKESRMEQLKEAMEQILTNDDLNKINAGILSFTTDPYDINDLYLTLEHNFANASNSTLQASLLNEVNDLTPFGGTPTARAIRRGIQRIAGLNGDTSPIEYQCQKHRMIVLTDGIANANTLTVNPFDTTETCSSAYPNYFDIPTASDNNDLNGRCSKEMIRWAYNNDFISGGSDTEGNPYSGTQNIVTDTIGFHTQYNTYAKDFLEEIVKGQNATNNDSLPSEGGFYNASSVDQLVQVFSTLLTQAIISTEIAYTAPSIPVNAENGAVNKNEFYIPLFKPEFRSFWKGNLKKYKIFYNEEDEILEIKDKNNGDVLTPQLTFVADSSSFWSDTDGGDPLAGGVAGVVNTQARTIYTNNGTESTLVNIEDLEIQNIAPSGTATQGDTDFGGVASRAIDGDTDGDFNNGSVTHTTNDSSNNWWLLDLGEEKDDLISVVLHNRTDCCEGRLNDFTLQVFDESNALVFTYNHSGNADVATEVTLPANTSGRFVRVDASASNILSLAEVEVNQKVVDYGWFVDAQTLPADTDNGRMGAPIHSAPVVYQKSDNETIIFLAGSDGVLHAFSDTGAAVTELWGYIPDNLIGLLEDFKDNIETDDQNSIVPPKYGLDGALELFEFKNSSGDVTKRLLVVGMRRGGRNYYALDVTNPTTPTLAWVIEGGVGDFVNLGQTWGTPQLTRLKMTGNTKDVLIFPGGYDDSQDDYVGARQDDSVGNAIYIVDALTGAELRTISASGADLNISDMKNAIAADVTLLDMNGNGLTNKLYAADTGGRIFRVDFNNTDMDGGMIADLSGTSPGTNRHFFNRPVVAYMGRYLAITIGSGMRPNIYDKTVNDRFYMVKDFYVWGPPPDSAADADDDPDYFTVRHTDLVNTTTSVTNTSNSYGWYFDLRHNETLGNGDIVSVKEKSITKSIVFDGVVYFSTVAATRDQVDVSCTPVASSSKSYFYAVSISDSAAVYKGFDLDATALDDISDRSRELESKSLPTSPFIFLDSTEITGDDGESITRPLGFFPIAPGIGEKTIKKTNNYNAIYWESHIGE